MLKMRKLILILLLICFSCGKDKIVQLPEIYHSEITEINDVSAAYLFYDETQKDSIELNRKNLISTTNWLVNVDKRLTLKQAFPQIIFLQNKKRNAEMHKNEAAKNYFTCNDTSKNNLGFIEFTNVFYHTEPAGEYFSKTSNIPENLRFSIVFNTSKDIEITGYIDDFISLKSSKKRLLEDLSSLFINEKNSIELILNYNQNLSFQDYISFKSMLLNSGLENVTIAKHEFIFN
jgi:hypothetical protein